MRATVGNGRSICFHIGIPRVAGHPAMLLGFGNRRSLHLCVPHFKGFTFCHLWRKLESSSSSNSSPTIVMVNLCLDNIKP